MTVMQFVSVGLFVAMGILGYLIWKRKQDEGEE